MIKRAPQKIGQDWHPADVKSELEKAGWSLRRLSRHHGFSDHYLAMVFQLPYTTVNAERIIATAIGRTPQEIWPSRFNPDGTRRPIKRASTIRREALKHSSQGGHACPVKDRRGC
jgi:Ner family transcriptional regulator